MIGFDWILSPEVVDLSLVAVAAVAVVAVVVALVVRGTQTRSCKALVTLLVSL